LSGALQLLTDASPQPPGTNVVHITIAAPAPPPGAWIAWTIGAALLGGAAALARRRLLRAARTPPRAGRIASAGLSAALALALLESPRDLMNGWSEFAVRLAGRLIFFTLVFGALFGALDLVLDAGRPERARRWLAIGIPLFVALLPLAIGATSLWEWTPMFAEGGPAAAALAGAVAGLVWWSCLPMPGEPLAYVFE
jgi:hypothetical protein